MSKTCGFRFCPRSRPPRRYRRSAESGGFQSFAEMCADDKLAPTAVCRIQIESADDFTLSGGTSITGATFTGLLTAGTQLSNVVSADVEIYRVFPALSDPARTIQVPTRANSPSDDALAARDSAAGTLTF